MAHVGEELALGAARLLGGVPRLDELGLARAELLRALLDLLLDRLTRLLELGLAEGDLPHLDDALEAGAEEHRVLEEDPARVLEPAPVALRRDPEDGEREVDAAQDVVDGDDDGRREEDLPVAVEGDEGERAEDVEVCLDPAAREVDEERRHHHLGGGDHVARDRPALAQDRDRDREERDRPSEEDRGEDVDVDRRLGPAPRPGRDEERRRDRPDPLEDHETGEQTVGLAAHSENVLGEERLGARREGRAGPVHEPLSSS